MKNRIGVLLVPVILFLVLICQAQVASKYNNPRKLNIVLANDDSVELQTKIQLLRLVSSYDISKWIFTEQIVIDKNSIPHSHPVLTLHTRHLKDDELLLSTFVHEQFHWYLTKKKIETDSVILELKAIFPKVPFGNREGGADELSTYLHLIICFLEYGADKQLLGEFKAKQVLQFWSSDHYTWVYKTVLEQEEILRTLLRKHKIIPIRNE